MKKVLLTLAVTAVSVAAMSMVAFADPAITVTKTSATVTGVEPGDYVSLLIVNDVDDLANVKDENIVYVDQVEAGTDKTATFTFPELDAETAKTAVVYSGYSSMAADATALKVNYQTSGGEEPDPDPKVVYGDVNGDGVVNAKDKTYLARYIAKWSGYETINEKNADVNGDGAVNAKDKTVLARYIAKWSGYETLPKK